MKITGRAAFGKAQGMYGHITMEDVFDMRTSQGNMAHMAQY